MNIFSPKGFLRLGGFIFILISVSGFIGILGDSPSRSVFGNSWWFDNNENLTLFVAGTILLFVSSVFPPLWQRYIVVLVGLLCMLTGFYSIFNPYFLGMSFEIPSDLIFYLLVGLWAFYAVYGNVGHKK
jgi:hypothetical protein